MVCTQCNPLFVLSKLKATETWQNDAKVKWPTSKRRAKVVNTDFTFQPYVKIQFVSPEDTAHASDECSDTESDATIDDKSDQPYNPEVTSESDYSSDLSQQSDEYLENAILKEPQSLVFGSSLLLLFSYFFTYKEQTKITSVRTKGACLVVTTKYHNKHIHTWQLW